MLILLNPYRDKIVCAKDTDCVINFGKYIYIFDEEMIDMKSRVSKKVFNKWKGGGFIEFDFDLEYWDNKKIQRPAKVYKFNVKSKEL